MSLASDRLTSQLQGMTERYLYGDDGFLIKSVPSGTYDTYNHPVVSTSSIPVTGSFSDKPSHETWKDHVDLAEINAEFRFKSQTAPEKGDQFKIVGRFGSLNYPNKTYEIAGIVNRGNFGFVIALKAVEV